MKFKMLIAVMVTGIFAIVNAETTYDWTTSGSYKVGESKSVKMPTDGEVYYKLSGLKAGNEYTFVVNGLGASVEVIYTYKEDGDLWDSVLASSSADVKTEDQERCLVTSEEWTDAYIVITDPEDKEWKVSPKGYYLHVEGEEGATIALSSMSGAVEEGIPAGDRDNPKEIKPSNTPDTWKSGFVDGSYYFTLTAKVGTYLLATTGGTESEPISLTFDSGAFTSNVVSDVSDLVATAGNKAYLIVVTNVSSASTGFHLDGSGSSFGLTYQYVEEGVLGKLTVNTKGTDATWSIKGASGVYENGETIAILGSQTVVFSKETGFSTPNNQEVTPTASNPNIEITGVYNDSYDPKDDVVSGASKISPAATEATAPRTLWAEDPADYFTFTAKDGTYYNFELEDLVGNALITIFAKEDQSTILAGPATKVLKFAKGKGDYVVRVTHGELAGDAQYELAYSSANVGTISFSKTEVSAKKSSGSVALTVKRSSGDGKVRVLYGTVNGTAQPGVDYVAQQGELVWENGDKQSKTITIKLIPEMYVEEAFSREFTVQLKSVSEDELGDDEYLASIVSDKGEATVTVTEAKSKSEKEIKVATVKTEDVPLETGSYQGVITEDGSMLTNGYPALAYVAFTSKDSSKKALSAKVTIGGKTYSFAADTWSEESDSKYAIAELVSTIKVGTESYENTLRVEVVRGDTSESGAWKDAAATVVLTMNVPDANGKGVQEGVVYSGELYRDNSKIQDYLTAIVSGAGYYTVSLVPSGVLPGSGIPAGNGYLTLTIDNKGKAKIAGMLADGTTKPSGTSMVAIRDDGDTMLVPVFVAKGLYCFGGTLRLVRGDDGRFVVDSSVPLHWNNDDASLTYDGEDGWNILVDPVGGYFNTVNNLQAYYLTHAVSASTVDASVFLEEVLGSGYSYVADIGPNGEAVALSGNTLSTDKRVLVKDGKLVDFENSVNPCNVQVKLTRATGIVTGSFSAWSQSEDGTAQKEVTGLKHYGVLLLSRDVLAPLASDVMTAGFFTQTATIKYEDDNGKSKSRKYTSSNPFNIIAEDQGDPDWYAEDWGEMPLN